MKLTNYTIYSLATNSVQEFTDFKSYIPAKANFAMQKNFAILKNAAQEIEQARLEVAKHYGIANETGEIFSIPEDKMEEVNKELNDLFNIEQELDIRVIAIEDLGSAEFTPSQMQTIMFMIEG